MNLDHTVQRVLKGEWLSLGQLEDLANAETHVLLAASSAIRDAGFGDIVSYSRKVFIPLTELCRDVCHYCTFAKAPRRVANPFMSMDAVLEVALRGRVAGCNEALLTLGEKPELRYAVAAEWLSAAGYASTIHYLADVAGRILRETGLLPHINAGTLTADELSLLRPVSASMGLMLETASSRLSGKGMPHHGSPDKNPEARVATLRRAGELNIPTTSGILIGIGETWRERAEALVAIRDLHAAHGHIQEVIVQNFCAKSGTRMADHPEPSTDELVRTIALARLALGAAVSVQAPPNLSPDALPQLVRAGINDWGGVSPVTPDHVNPEAPWPSLEDLANQTKAAGKRLVQRLTIYPCYIADPDRWLDPAVKAATLKVSDTQGLARECDWAAGGGAPPPARDAILMQPQMAANDITREVRRIVGKGMRGDGLDVAELQRLFDARGADFTFVCASADHLRKESVGDVVSYVVTRNINYTNVCTYGCRFCAFSKGKTHEDLRGKPYDLTLDEIARRTREAWERGATEVCMQGGIHPDYTGQTYIDICRTVKEACPEMHVHAFSPLEVAQGAKTLGTSLRDFLVKLKEAGLGSLPGTAAEILDNEVRAIICPDKLTTAEWLEVIETAHLVGLRTTSTIMFGHVEQPVHWARHLVHLRSLQERTGGITEFVPLPFVAKEAPIFLKGMARPGPTFREAILMHAVARIALHPVIPNIQASWVKLGPAGARLSLKAGVNDLGGTLMNESITRAAGAIHGQEAAPDTIEDWIRQSGRIPRQRTTLYGHASTERRQASFNPAELAPVVNSPVRRRPRPVPAGC